MMTTRTPTETNERWLARLLGGDFLLSEGYGKGHPSIPTTRKGPAG